MTTEEQAQGADRIGRGNRYYRGPVSDHFDGTVFFNPGHVPDTRSLRTVARWQLGGGRTPWPKRFESPVPPTRPARCIEGERLVVTMVGHATLLIQTEGLNILTDPVWSERASPVAVAGPKRVNAPGIRFADLPPIDLVLLTHNHYDHMDIGTLKCLRAVHDPLVITPLGNDAILHAADPRIEVAALDWGEAREFRSGVKISAEPCHHWSARGIKDRCMALWAAFVIETPHGAIYHVGDTGFDEGRNYRAAAGKFGGFRLAILPIGAYEPRWFMQHHHQNPDEAVRGMQLANAANAIGHHWGTFRLTNEGITDPPEALARACREHDVPPERFRTPRPGESIEIAPAAVSAPAGNRG
jgi:L-ascorbate metabolism protein UlaG (beta-lactamase superfamily)